MTVSTTKAEQVYTGNAAATTFATNFKLLEASHLIVRIRTIATGAEVTKTLDVDYSISGLEADAGATVTYPISGSPLPATEQIVLIRSVPFEQNTSIKNQTGFFPSVLENAYDLIVMMAQQVNDKAKRSLQFAVGSTFSQELPLLSGNRTLVTNAGGTAFIQGPTVTAIESAEANATAAAASAVDAAASAAAAALFDPDNFQPIDATLTSISALGTAANKFAYTTDVDTWAEADVTAAGRALLDDADAAAQRTTLDLSAIASKTGDAGDIAYHTGTDWARLAKGAEGQVLLQGASAPEWGNQPIKAWVNFNGTGTVAIRASENVSSITDNGTNNYTVNLVTPMPDSNYVVNVSMDTLIQTNNQAQGTPQVINLTVNGFDLFVDGTSAESDLWMATVIGN